MPHVHSISSDDDDLDEEDWGLEEPGERRPIPWIPIAAAGGAVVLLIILVVVLMSGGGSGKAKPVADEPTTAAGPQLEALAATDPRVVAVQAALDAWGTFESTGKVADLGTTMAPTGPQYKALAVRAPSIKPGGQPFTVVVTNPRLVPPSDAQTAAGEQVVRADLVWKRDGKADKTIVWDMTLRGRTDPAGLWLWTAKSAPANDANPDTAGNAGPVAGDLCAAAKTAAGVPTSKDVTGRIDTIQDDGAKLTAIVDVLGQRLAADQQVAASAPQDIKAQADAVAKGSAEYLALVKTAKKISDLTAINKKADANATYKAGEKARPAVVAYLSTKCGVDTNPDR
jgi:hypothetical protein